MKAKVIATGEILKVVDRSLNLYVWLCKEDGSIIRYKSEEVEFICDKKIDWEQRRFDLAKFALQGLLSNVKYQELSDGYNELAKTKGKTFDETVFYAELACGFADAVILKLVEG